MVGVGFRQGRSNAEQHETARHAGCFTQKQKDVHPEAVASGAAFSDSDINNRAFCRRCCV